jgi:hypothetical protein
MSTKTGIYIDGTSGTVEISTIDYSTEAGPFWYVVCDDTPVSPDRPLPFAHAMHEFERAVKRAAEDGDGEVVELRECTAEDLAWAGIDVGGDSDD